MKAIFDTNILIHIEDPVELSRNLQDLLKLLREYGHTPLIHPSSLQDLSKDKDTERRKIIESKLKGYPVLEAPPSPTGQFLSIIGPVSSDNDRIDADLLFALYKEAADFLITEDGGIHRKAAKIGLEDRVLSIDGALDYFRRLHSRARPKDLLLKEVPVYTLDIDDPFFDSLKEDYSDSGFREWFSKISREGRKCWVYRNNEGLIKAILILKEEDDVIDTSPPLPRKLRLKICTLKVDIPGSKVGELLLKLAFEYCVKNRIYETYLTHFTKPDDLLANLIENFGFDKVAVKKTGEDIYLKTLVPPTQSEALSPSEIATKYYPSFKDSPEVRKFVVPIKPQYHDKLFPELHKGQYSVLDYVQFNIPGNAIRKAYISHSKIHKIRQGDIILFYRSTDQRQLTVVGIVEDTLRTHNAADATRFVGKRSVYSYDEISQMTQKPALIIRFRQHLILPNPVNLKNLHKYGIPVPQSIAEIGHESYILVKKESNIDERFTVH